MGWINKIYNEGKKAVNSVVNKFKKLTQIFGAEDANQNFDFDGVNIENSNSFQTNKKETQSNQQRFQNDVPMEISSTSSVELNSQYLTNNTNLTKKHVNFSTNQSFDDPNNLRK